VQKKRGITLLLIVLAMVFAFSAVSAQDEGNIINVAWPYQPPPTGHFNPYATNGLTLGIYNDVSNPPLAIYKWAAGAYEGYLAESFGFDEDNNYVVTLKSGIMWSDGTPVTSADVVGTFVVRYLLNHQAWASISNVEAVDDLTVKFTVTAASAALERYIITENIYNAADFQATIDAALPLIASGAKAGDAGFDAALTALTEARPETLKGSGAFVIDPASINANNIMLVKNEGGLGSDVTKWDQVRVWNGETDTVTPLVANGDLWYITHGIPPATEQAFTDEGIDIVRGHGFSGPAIYVNYDVAPLNMVEVRQAIAYTIDREENGFVSLGESGLAVENMTGLADSLGENWIPEDVQGELNTYDPDLDKAAELLESVGYTMGADGKWADADGNKLSFELKFPAEFADWSAAAENAITQLNNNGWDITGRAVQFEQQVQDVYDGDFQMAIRNWGIASPFPVNSYLEPFQRYNGQGELASEEVGGGMRFDVNVTYSGGEINLLDATVASGQGLDVDAQKALVGQIALAYNELLPAIPLWERLGNNALNRNFLDLPASDDPLLGQPWGGTDAWMPYLILTGGVGPAAAS
jgi:peptide/nickel transport system substrate-binding protein